ncbi:MAG: redoxin domain-containing protein [Chloroflexi bacterium]|nr:redoxin domain-containing protein [Chloroflexota bacterium]
MRRELGALAPRALAVATGGLLFLLGACGPSASAVQEGPPQRSRLAADLQGIEGWINSPPIASLQELEGKVVLLDFWTYTCINCIRTLPHLRAWHEAYAAQGLVIVGIHTPEFNFEKSPANVQRATQDLGVPWPVALDNARRTWDAFHVRAWPTKVLLGPDGTERARVIGEGQYEELEQRIRLLLVEAGKEVQSSPARLPEPDLESYRRLTREMYAGWRWEFLTQSPFLGNPGASRPDEAVLFTDPSPPRPDGVYFLHGLWERQEESVRHARRTEQYEDYVALAYRARVANAVIRPQGEVPFRVLVTLDGRPLTEENRGKDVVLEDGASYLVVREPRLYELVAGRALERHELRLSPQSDAFALHAFTFGP